VIAPGGPVVLVEAGARRRASALWIAIAVTAVAVSAALLTCPSVPWRPAPALDGGRP